MDCKSKCCNTKNIRVSVFNNIFSEINMQNIKLNYQNLNGHVAIPENDGAGIIGSLSTLYKSIKQTIKQPFISDTAKL